MTIPGLNGTSLHHKELFIPVIVGFMSDACSQMIAQWYNMAVTILQAQTLSIY